MVKGADPCHVLSTLRDGAELPVLQQEHSLAVILQCGYEPDRPVLTETDRVSPRAFCARNLANPGQVITLPARATALSRGRDSRPVQGSDLFRPTEPGLSFLLSGTDTIGALAVNLDPRESELARASDGSIRQLWPEVRLATIGRAREVTYAAGGRADLRGWVLGLAALLAIADASFAGWGRKSRSRS